MREEFRLPLKVVSQRASPLKIFYSSRKGKDGSSTDPEKVGFWISRALEALVLFFSLARTVV